jgi:HK97 family phage major capsid protein
MSTANPFDEAAARRALSDIERAQSALRLIAPAKDNRWQQLLSRYSLASAITGLRTEQRAGVANEVHTELARMQATNSPNSLIVPWEVLSRGVQTRADVVGTLSAGGYLVETEVTPAVEALRALLLCGPLGATILQATGNVNIPLEKTPATAIVINGETAQATEADQTFGQLSLVPKTVSAYTEISRLLLLQSNVEQLVRRSLGKTVGRIGDKLALTGTGLAGEPTGVIRAPGINTFSGTSLALAGMSDALVALGDGLDPVSIGIAANRTTAGLLRKRQEFTSSSLTLWQGSIADGTCCGERARSSTSLPSGALIVGSWAYLVIATWGQGLEIALNPYANFQQGIVGLRCFMSFDSGVYWPSAFNYASTVT